MHMFVEAYIEGINEIDTSGQNLDEDLAILWFGSRHLRDLDLVILLNVDVSGDKSRKRWGTGEWVRCVV